MKTLLIRSLLLSACVLTLSFAAHAQRPADKTKTRSDNSGVAALRVAGKATVVVVGTTGKVAWGVTKFTAKHLAEPVAKTVFVKVAPSVAKFALKNTLKYGLPFAAKLSIL